MASRLLAGFALGIVAGILMAPDKGSETRKKIAQKGKELRDQFNNLVETIQERFGEEEKDPEQSAEGVKHPSPLFSDEAGVWNS